MRLKLSRFRRNFNKDLPIEFTEQNLSSFGGLELFSRYLRRVELSRRVGKACRGKGIRSDYGSVRLVLVLVGMLLVGARRLEHLQYVCDDPMLLRFCGLRRLTEPSDDRELAEAIHGRAAQGPIGVERCIGPRAGRAIGSEPSDGRYGTAPWFRQAIRLDGRFEDSILIARRIKVTTLCSLTWLRRARFSNPEIVLATFTTPRVPMRFYGN